ncbi:MAG: hypothetical protein RLN62_04205 [Rickettsiales bacterium]
MCDSRESRWIMHPFPCKQCVAEIVATIGIGACIGLTILAFAFIPSPETWFDSSDDSTTTGDVEHSHLHGNSSDFEN